MSPAELKAAEEKTAATERRIREIAANLEDRRARALDRAATMNKWLLASLLALNGGALLAIQDSALPTAPGARLAFLIGIVFAVLSGLAAQIEGEAMGERAEQLHSRVLDYLAGESLAETTKAMPKGAFLINAATLASPVCLMLSLIAFVNGAFRAGGVTALF